MAEPERPEHPPERYLEQRSAQRSRGDGEHWRTDHSVEPLEYAYGGERGEEQRAEYARRHAEDAEAQAEWERESTEIRTNDGDADALA